MAPSSGGTAPVGVRVRRACGPIGAARPAYEVGRARGVSRAVEDGGAVGRVKPGRGPDGDDWSHVARRPAAAGGRMGADEDGMGDRNGASLLTQVSSLGPVPEA